LAVDIFENDLPCFLGIIYFVRENTARVDTFLSPDEQVLGKL
jgi:hypothetical protein